MGRDKPANGSPQGAGPARQERQAQALRENLARRKQQSRARAARQAEPTPEESDNVPSED